MHLSVFLLTEASPPNRTVGTTEIWVQRQVCSDALNQKYKHEKYS